jgi:hypothetical protein
LNRDRHAARICAINLIAQMKLALGDLERVTRVVKLGGFVNAAKRFHRHSEGDQWLFGPDGRGVRRQGAPCPLSGGLPCAADWRAVEVDAVVEFKPDDMSERLFDVSAHVYAHRGLWDATRRRIRSLHSSAAHAAGVGVELDVRLTVDERACRLPRRKP